MLNKTIKTTLICLMFIILSLNSSYANVPQSVLNVQSGISFSKSNMNLTEKNYDNVHFVMQKLINDWAANQDEVKKGKRVTLIAAGASLVSACVAVASGGSLAPAAYGAFVALYHADITTRDEFESAHYLTTMDVVMTDLNNALWDVSAAYNGGFLSIYENGVVIDYLEVIGYAAWYDKYLQAWAGHNLVRFEYDSDGNHVRSSVYNTAQKIEDDYSLSGWYHKEVTSPSPSDFDHNIDRELRYKHYDSPEDQPSNHSDDWDTFGLPYSNECLGPCNTMFETPLEAFRSHKILCGDDYHVVNFDLDGCGREYYKCPGHDVPSFHDVFRCTRHNYEKIDGKKVKVYCGKHFRQCTNYVIDNNGRYSSLVTPSGYCTKLFLEGVFGVHSYFSSDAPSSWETAYTDDADDDSADAGDGSSSAMHACGIHATTVSGSHSQITPPCGDSAHAGYACQISSDHNTAMSGWSGTFYECQPHTNYPCGHTDPTANSAYHVYHTSCTQTNANGQSCTVTNFYDCGQHTHVYPAPTISCGRSACTQTVTSSTQHSATCASGHSYWTCNPSDVSLHITRTCRLSTCGKSWERCSTVGGTPLCDDPWRRSNGLPCWKK